MYNVYFEELMVFCIIPRVYAMCMSLTTSESYNALKHSQLTLNALQFWTRTPYIYIETNVCNARITQIYGFLLHLGKIEYFNTGCMKQRPIRDIKVRFNVYTAYSPPPPLHEFGNLIADSNQVRDLVHLHELAFKTAAAQRSSL